MHTLIPVHSR